MNMEGKREILKGNVSHWLDMGIKGMGKQNDFEILKPCCLGDKKIIHRKKKVEEETSVRVKVLILVYTC
jgi:hypothetical protein